jgi:hypothetical protein
LCCYNQPFEQARICVKPANILEADGEARCNTASFSIAADLEAIVLMQPQFAFQKSNLKSHQRLVYYLSLTRSARTTLDRFGSQTEFLLVGLFVDCLFVYRVPTRGQVNIHL